MTIFLSLLVLWSCCFDSCYSCCWSSLLNTIQLASAVTSHYKYIQLKYSPNLDLLSRLSCRTGVFMHWWSTYPFIFEDSTPSQSFSWVSQIIADWQNFVPNHIHSKFGVHNSTHTHLFESRATSKIWDWKLKIKHLTQWLQKHMTKLFGLFFLCWSWYTDK